MQVTTRPGKKGEKPEVEVEERCEPEETHYGDARKCKFRPGELYRIWHPYNIDVHLNTFVIENILGTSMSCLKLEYCSPDEVDRKFDSTHVKLRVANYASGSYRHRRSSSRLRAKQQQEVQTLPDFTMATVYMDKQQRLKEDCYIDVAASWNIDWQSEYYRFAYCGALEDESIANIQEIHEEWRARSRK